MSSYFATTSSLCKLKHPPPSLDEVDPKFLSIYGKSKHGAQLKKDLDLSHLEPAIRNCIYTLVKKYWSIFDDKGVFIPVKNYECVIDTGYAKPITAKKILYGTPRKSLSCGMPLPPLRKSAIYERFMTDAGYSKRCWLPNPIIDKFVWRFCVNYIPLNSVTQIIAYPIPRCDLAIYEEFGLGTIFWLWDAPLGYHQLAVALANREKLAFQGLDAIKWTYTFMPFGPTNGWATFINFIHDVDGQWKALAQQSGLIINDDTNTKIIVDNIFSWSKLLEKALLYMECQLCFCQAYRLSLSLKKSCIFSKRFEFVRIDVCPDGNCPVMSKRQLLVHWPQPEFIQSVAKIVGFAQFYGKFIPQFEFELSHFMT